MKIGILNPSSQIQQQIRDILSANSDFQVIWTATALDLAIGYLNAPVDLVLVGLNLQKPGPTEAVRQILAQSSASVLVTTETIRQAHSEVFDAMGAGAIDVVEVSAPPDAVSSTEANAEFLYKVRNVARLRGIKLAGGRVAHPVPAFSPEHSSTPLLAIGSSTGGPGALLTLLGGLPATFPYPIAIVQHVDQKFSSGLAEWLDNQIALKAEIIHQGANLRRGVVSIAASNDHLIMKPDFSLAYTVEPKECPYRPSVDVFFQSISQIWPNKHSCAVLLTGMGKDGALGLLKLKEAGWHTIAQDKETSVVYGMPKAAADIGAAGKILPIDQIAAAILRFFGL